MKTNCGSSPDSIAEKSNEVLADVGLNFFQKVEKEAYLMIKEYSKEEAEKLALNYANDWVKEINELKYYDGEKIKRMNDRRLYWLTVASAIKKIGHNRVAYE